MGGSRNKAAGSGYERSTVNKLKATRFFPHVATSRLVSRLRDNQKIDICNTDEDEQGRLQYNFQTKTLVNQPNFIEELKKIPVVEGILNVFLLKKTEKKGTRFMTVGNLAVMSEDDFFRLIVDRERYLAAYEILNEYFDSISEEEQVVVHEQLQQLDL